MEEHSLLDVFDAYVLEDYVACDVVVAHDNAHRSAVWRVVLVVLEDVDVGKAESFDHFALRVVGVAVAADVDGVCYVGPEHGIFHCYVGRASAPVPAVVVEGYAVIAVAHEYVVDGDVAAAHHVDSVAPSAGAE